MNDTTWMVITILAAVPIFFLCLNHVWTAVAPPKQKTWLTDYQYAHRGLHDGNLPENSLQAFENAARAGYAIEMDVQLSKDGRVMVFHDTRLDRMTAVHGKIKDFTYDELRTFRLNGSDYTIPTLEEVLAMINGRVPILFELKKKGVAGKLERAFYQLVKSYEGKFAVQSFSPFSIRWFKKNAPHVLRGQLACDFRFCQEFSRIKRFLLAKLLFVVRRLEINFICRPNFISYELHKVNSTVIKRLRECGAPILAWTIRNEEQYQNASPYIDSVIFENFRPNGSEAA